MARTMAPEAAAEAVFELLNRRDDLDDPDKEAAAIDALMRTLADGLDNRGLAALAGVLGVNLKSRRPLGLPSVERLLRVRAWVVRHLRQQGHAQDPAPEQDKGQIEEEDSGK